MENANGIISGTNVEYDSVLLSATELYDLRKTFVLAIKKIDRVLAGKDLKGKTMADYILNGICSFYGINRLELKKYRRNPQLVERRRMSAYILKRYTDRTMQEISDMLGYLEHATVNYHIKEAENLLSDEIYGDDSFKKTYKRIIKHLNL